VFLTDSTKEYPKGLAKRGDGVGKLQIPNPKLQGITNDQILNGAVGAWLLVIPWNLGFGIWSFRTRWTTNLLQKASKYLLARQASKNPSGSVKVVDAHYLTNHPNSAVDWITSHLGLGSSRLGLLSRRWIGGGNHPDSAALASVAPSAT